MKFFRLFSLCMVFAGTVVGAGFASGLEIWVFFGKYGIFGFSGVLLTGIVISLCGAGIILGVFDGDFTTHDEFCRKICGRYSGSFFSVLGIVFMFSAFSIMLSGSGALFSQEFGRSYCEGVIFMAVICFFVFIFIFTLTIYYYILYINTISTNIDSNSIYININIIIIIFK